MCSSALFQSAAMGRLYGVPEDVVLLFSPKLYPHLLSKNCVDSVHDYVQVKWWPVHLQWRYSPSVLPCANADTQVSSTKC